MARQRGRADQAPTATTQAFNENDGRDTYKKI
jgi:hypothetical protein